MCVMVGYGLRVVTADVNALEKGTSPPFYRQGGSGYMEGEERYGVGRIPTPTCHVSHTLQWVLLTYLD